MKKTPFLIAAALIPLAGIGIGIAAAGDEALPKTPAGSSVTFEALDTNQDGRISMPEASADPSLVEGFSAADKNGDGYLDNAEYDKGTKKR